MKAIVHHHLKNIPMWQEDCVNDVMLRVWQNIDRFDSQRSSLKNWVAAIARYCSIDYKRKYCRCTEELDENTQDKKADMSFMKREIQEEIQDLLSALSPKDREIFIQRYFMDMAVEDIAASEGKTSGYVYNRLSRGRKKLRRLFAKER